MSQEHQALDDPAEAFPPEMNEYNAREYVTAPPATDWSYVDQMNDATKITVTRGADGQTISVRLEFGEPGEPRHQLLVADLDTEEVLEMHEQVLAPFIQHQHEIDQLSERVAAAREREDELAKAELQANADASAFCVQKLERGSMMSYHDKPYRLHLRSCAVPRRAKNTHSELCTLDEITTKVLPRAHAMLEQYLHPNHIQRNARRLDKREKGYVRHTILDTVVLALCGVCKPLGARTQAVAAELRDLCNLTTPDPLGLVKAVHLLTEIEQACTELDAEYQEQRRNEGDQ